MGVTAPHTPTYLLGIRAVGRGGHLAGGVQGAPLPAPARGSAPAERAAPVAPDVPTWHGGGCQRRAAGPPVPQFPHPAGAVLHAPFGGSGHDGAIRTHHGRGEVSGATPKPSLGLQRGSG